MPENAWVALASRKPNNFQVAAESFLPTLRCISRPVEAELQLAEQSGAVLGVVRRQVDVDVSVDFGIELGSPNVINHDHPTSLVLGVRGCIADYKPEGFKGRSRCVEGIVPSYRELFSH